MNTDNRIYRLVTEAYGRAKDDPDRLWKIVQELNTISAWVEGREVERLAEDAERRLADMDNLS